MEKNIDNYFRKVLAAGVGAAEISYEKVGAFVDECVKRGEVTVEKGRVLNEELKHKCQAAADGDAKKTTVDVENLTEEERAALLEKLMKMKDAKQE